MLTGSTQVIVPMFKPANVAEAINRHNSTDALLVPTVIQMLVDSPELVNADCTSLRRILYGATVISEAVLERARTAFPTVGASPRRTA